MDYLLVVPKKLSTGANTTSIIFPLGIAYVSAALKKAGYRIEAVDPGGVCDIAFTCRKCGAQG